MQAFLIQLSKTLNFQVHATPMVTVSWSSETWPLASGHQRPLPFCFHAAVSWSGPLCR